MTKAAAGADPHPITRTEIQAKEKGPRNGTSRKPLSQCGN